MRLSRAMRISLFSREPAAQQRGARPKVSDPRESLISHLVANPGDIEHFHRDARTGLYYDLPGRSEVLLEVIRRQADARNQASMDELKQLISRGAGSQARSAEAQADREAEP